MNKMYPILGASRVAVFKVMTDILPGKFLYSLYRRLGGP